MMFTSIPTDPGVLQDIAVYAKVTLALGAAAALFFSLCYLFEAGE